MVLTCLNLEPVHFSGQYLQALCGEDDIISNRCGFYFRRYMVPGDRQDLGLEVRQLSYNIAIFEIFKVAIVESRPIDVVFIPNCLKEYVDLPWCPFRIE